MYSVLALWSAAREGAAVVVVVVNNGRYGILESFRDFIGAGDRVPGLDLPELDVVRVGEGFGCEGAWVERPKDLRGALERAFSAGRPYVLDVTVEAAVPKLVP